MGNKCSCESDKIIEVETDVEKDDVLTNIMKISNRKASLALTEIEESAFNFVNKFSANNGEFQGNLNSYGFFSGFGVFTTKEGTQFQGYFAENKISDFVIINSRRGISVKTFIGSHPSKEFSVINTDYSKYEGEAVLQVYHGVGTEKAMDTYFSGFFKEGKKQSGRLKWQDGHEYRGEFQNNKMHGYVSF